MGSKILFLDFELFICSSVVSIKGRFSVLYRAYDVIFFVENLSFVNMCKLLIKNFFNLRGLTVSPYSFHNIYDDVQISFQEMSFRRFNNRTKSFKNSFGVINSNKIQKYKRELKLIVKSSFKVEFLLSLLNKKITEFRINYSFCDFYNSYALFFDLYLNKLLWKWARRRHPRRTHSWIYSKYWTLFSGYSKFFCLQFKVGKFLILKSHKISVDKIFPRFPLTFEVFDLYNVRKFKFLFFTKFKSRFIGFYRILFETQKGFCGFCRQPLFSVLDSRIIFIRRIIVANKLVSSFFLVHKYCNNF